MEPLGTKSLSIEVAGRKLTVESGYLANQADGSVVVSLGDTVLLATATMSGEPREGVDFFPMMVDFEERYYATGKIKGSRFIKREGRPSEKSILTARMTDRPLRPLFPKGMANDVQIIITALSLDLEVDPGTTAIIAASSALMISGMPFAGPVSAVRIGLVDGKLIVNPTYEQCRKGNLDLVVAGTLDAITMVEAGAKEVPEEKILEALELAHGEIKKICELQINLRGQVKPEPLKYIVAAKDEASIEAVKSFVTPEMLAGLWGETKMAFKHNLHEVEELLFGMSLVLKTAIKKSILS